MRGRSQNDPDRGFGVDVFEVGKAGVEGFEGLLGQGGHEGEGDVRGGESCADLRGQRFFSEARSQSRETQVQECKGAFRSRIMSCHSGLGTDCERWLGSIRTVGGKLAVG